MSVDGNRSATRKPRTRLCAHSGAELIEFALVLPVLLLLVAGIIDFGLLFQRYLSVTNAAREGARVGVLPEYSTADVQARVDAYLTAAGLTAAHPAPAVTAVAIPGPGGVTTTGVQVLVTYPHTFTFLGPISRLLGGSYGTLNLRATVVMRVESMASGS